MAAAPSRTELLFHHDAKLHEHDTAISSLIPFNSLPESSQSLFKLAPEEVSSDLYAATCPSTIFHPQGGGQPSDVGTITSIASPSTRFEVITARTDPDGQVLHLGRFTEPNTPAAAFASGTPVTLEIDSEKRLLFSRLHTAGHVLGAAVRHVAGPSIPGFDELKASHFPGSASCEFAGSIAGSFKEPIQAKLDEYINASLPVEIEFWTEDDFSKEGVERLIPTKEVREAMGVREGEKFRVVRIRGAEVYPCGGTHVERSDGCGKTTVRKIVRNKGMSRVAYTVEGA